MKKNLHKLDIFLLIFIPVIASIICLYFRFSYFSSLLLFFVLPSIYFSWRNKKRIASTVVFSLSFIPLVGILINYFAIRDGSWYVPTTLFPRILGMIAVEDLILSFFFVYFLIICYEHFLDKGRHHLMEKRFLKFFVIPISVFLILFLSLYYLSIEIFNIDYFYLKICIFTIIIPITIILILFPRLFSKYVKVGVYFVFLSGLYEYVGVSLDYWIFPGHNFIGHVGYFGYLIPIEEVVSFIALTSVALVSYYEFFDDDCR